MNESSGSFQDFMQSIEENLHEMIKLSGNAPKDAWVIYLLKKDIIVNFKICFMYLATLGSIFICNKLARKMDSR